MSGSPVLVRQLTARDHATWHELYTGYAACYGEDASEAAAQRVWGWLMDPAHELEAVVAEQLGRPVGLAHFRVHGRARTAPAGGILEDLFVVSSARSAGVADDLLSHLRTVAHDRGWTIVHLIPAGQDHRGTSRYDRVATRTTWMTA